MTHSSPARTRVREARQDRRQEVQRTERITAAHDVTQCREGHLNADFPRIDYPACNVSCHCKCHLYEAQEQCRNNLGALNAVVKATVAK